VFDANRKPTYQAVETPSGFNLCCSKFLALSVEMGLGCYPPLMEQMRDLISEQMMLHLCLVQQTTSSFDLLARSAALSFADARTNSAASRAI
jgi:hypothetical protein